MEEKKKNAAGSSVKQARAWNITTHIGPVTLNIMIDSTFFDFANQQYGERHTHGMYEFHYITQGAGIVATDNSTYEIGPDSYYIIKAGVYHMQNGLVRQPFHRYSFKFDFDITRSAYDYPEAEIRDFVYVLSNINFFISENFSRISNTICAIQAELTNQPIGYLLKVEHLFSLLFIDIYRDIAIKNASKQKISSSKTKENIMSIIDNFFDLNYDHKANIQELCELVHLSKSQLNRILIAKYNMSFKQKHTETQIEHIKDILLHTDLSISAIAEKTGYASEGNFSAFFKHQVGISPKFFRQSNKKSR